MTSSISEVSKIFESKIRIQMLASLTIADLTYNQLKEICQCTDGNMTTHTRKLIDENFISINKEFVKKKPRTTYHLTELGRKSFFEYVDILNELANKE